jgi:hypothetical protein
MESHDPKTCGILMDGKKEGRKEISAPANFYHSPFNWFQSCSGASRPRPSAGGALTPLSIMCLFNGGSRRHVQRITELKHQGWDANWTPGSGGFIPFLI